MLLRRSQADDTNNFLIRVFSENHHMQAGNNQTNGDKAQLTVIEPIIFALQRGIQSKPFACAKETPCLARLISSFAGSNSIVIYFTCTQ
jgi:hypothetical protein